MRHRENLSMCFGDFSPQTPFRRMANKGQGTKDRYPFFNIFYKKTEPKPNSPGSQIRLVHYALIEKGKAICFFFKGNNKNIQKMVGTISEHASDIEAVPKMREESIGSLLVVREGIPMGILRDTDIIQKAVGAKQF